jgi:N-acetylglucosamine-6-phosphate deacetylase
MKAIVGGTVYTPDDTITDGVVLLDGATIRAVGPRSTIPIPSGSEVIDARGSGVAPGYVDGHIHGLLGYDAMGATLAEVIGLLPRFGVTSFLATTLTVPEERLLAGLRQMAAVLADPPPGATCLGIHIEGPHLSPQWPGMATARWFKPLTAAGFDRLQEAAGGYIRTITFAPEEGEAMAVIPHLVANNVVPSVGHSDATLEQVRQAAGLGLRRATHAYNAMRPLRHRDPGVVGALMENDAIWAELIADGLHVHPAAMSILLRVKGTARVVLVSDGAPLAGLPDGEYGWHNERIIVHEGSCRLANGALAGAHRLLDSGVRNLIALVGATPQQALRCATRNAAESIGAARKGQIGPGFDADLVILDERFVPTATIIGGEPMAGALTRAGRA